MGLVDEDTGVVIARDVKVADGFFGRFRGLMLKREFYEGEALFFIFKRPGRNSVHTFFMKFPIDLIYLDSSYTVVEIRNFLKPWHLHRSRAVSSYLIELPAGTVSRFKVKLGHKISRGKSFNP